MNRGPKLFRVLTAVVLVSVLVVISGRTTTGLASTPSRATAAATSQRPVWNAFVKTLRNKYQGKTLRLIMIDDPFIGAFRQVGAQFSQLTGAKLAIDSYAYDATYQKEVLAGSQHSSTYNIYVFDVPWTEKFVPYTVPLNPYIRSTNQALIQYNDFFRVMREASSWRGRVIGFPFAPYFMIQHYNTAYYSKLGLRPATNLAQWVRNARIANKNPKLPTVYGTAMNNQSGSPVGQAYFEYVYQYAGGRPFQSEHPGSMSPYSDMTPRFASPQSIATVNLFKRLLKYEPPGALNIAWTNRQEYFNTGRIAAVNQWDVTTPSVSDPKQSVVGRTYATAPLPTNAQRMTPVGGWTMGINRYSSLKGMSWDFIKWFTSPEISVKFALAGGFPPRNSSLRNPQLLAKYPWYRTLQQVEPYAYAEFRPRISQSFDIISTLGTYISKALSGQMSTRQAMLAADRAVGTMLRKAGYRVTALNR